MATPNPMPVAFHGSTLYVIDHQGEPFVPMKPVVEGMGLAWQTQHRKFTENAQRWGTVTIMATVGGDGKKRDLISVPLRKLPGWLMSIHPNKVKAAIREKVIEFQNECDDVLWQHWQKRHPQATPMVRPEVGPEDSQWVEGLFNGQRIRALVGFTCWEVCLEDCAAALGYRSPVDLYKLTPGGMWRKLPPAMGESQDPDPITLVRPTAILSALTRSQRQAAPALAEYLERELFFEGRIAAEVSPTRADLDHARQLFEEDPGAFLGRRVWLLCADPAGHLQARPLRDGEVLMEMSELEHVKRAYDTLDDLVRRRELELAFPRQPRQ
ncbi:phage antirepressor N-terminal domain-containing protein [Halomonas sp. EGI 63088]|uniref:Phage antirepressor N-terminal domain-containing protein n=1 Tax=Halomonas flagellata TaxID=2920385 RepID=A0ABS9RU47_9GAMM|nr:phage antirepressor N-terminal domain-containing protein [Halomonas flagellata]MCH4563341.1 phage antirepressor N-terminal domain-containing protein [Halomonas flagellata]